MATEVTSLHAQIAAQVTAAIARAHQIEDVDPVVRRSQRGADFQANAALTLAARTDHTPQKFADAVAKDLQRHINAGVEVSGPGFLNLTLADSAIWAQVAALLADPQVGVPAVEVGRRTVVDYSSPNVAKQMHVGHFRTTVIGDCLARVIGRLGGEVLRRNHVGDWGTQFGKLIQYLNEHPGEWHPTDLNTDDAIAALDKIYKDAHRIFESDPQFAVRARRRVVALQSGDPDTTAVWRELVAVSEAAFQTIYDRLNVLLEPEDTVPESFYNPMLTDVVEQLIHLGIAAPSDGAIVAFSLKEKGPDGKPVAFIVQKRDGGYNYNTTDVAAIRHRIREKADRLLYVTDARQAQHFELVFEIARRAGWLTGATTAAHVPYGTILGPDGRPFKTRSGDTVPLTVLLDQAVAHARAVVAAKNPDMPPAELDAIATQAGIGAVKYADLSTSRTKDYSFDPARMVTLTGNTGVYLQYTHTRARSILRTADGSPQAPATVDTTIPLHSAERTLALHLDGYAATLIEVANTLEPHRLCGYLYALARAFTAFYEACPVLHAETSSRHNRLALTRLTAAILADGLSLLGITAPTRM